MVDKRAKKFVHCLLIFAFVNFLTILVCEKLYIFLGLDFLYFTENQVVFIPVGRRLTVAGGAS